MASFNKMWIILLVGCWACNPPTPNPNHKEDIFLEFTVSYHTEGYDVFQALKGLYDADSLKLFSATGEKIPTSAHTDNQGAHYFKWIPLYDYPKDQNIVNQEIIREFELVIPSVETNEEGNSIDSISTTISLKYKVGQIENFGFGIIEIQSQLPNIQFPEEVRPTRDYCDIIISE